METKLVQEINNVLRAFPSYWENELLMKNKVIDDIRVYKEDLIEALLRSELIKETYSMQIGSNIIFKIEDFINMLRYKNYWENSYTKYSNEIGLTSEGKYLKYNSDVVLNFPHKDCVLEGGMTKEDVNKNEIYYHNVLAKEEIDTIFSPKVLSNIKKINEDGEHEIHEFNDTDNLIIKGNNLIALHTLKKRYAGKVKSIIIDPPYYFNKTKNKDSFTYNSNFKLSTWLTFMKNRLVVSKELLSEDGFIAILIGVDGYAHLKLLVDEVFNEDDNYIGTITWRKTDNQTNIGHFANVIDYILLYRKSKDSKLNRLPLTDKAMKEYTYEDEKGKYRRANILDQTRGRYHYKVVTPDGSILNGPWMIEKSEYEKIKMNNEIHWPKRGKQIPYGKIYLSESMENGQITSDFWDGTYGTNQRSADEIKALFDDRVFDYAKPEKLLMNLISLTSKEGDLVLDFFMGSATTQAVAHKMNRQYIGVEQMDYINTVSVPRLKKVIEGEQGGISKDVDWQGGGSFIYAELHNLNYDFVKRIQQAENEQQLEVLIKEIEDTAYLNFKVDFEKVKEDTEHFISLTLQEKKDILIKTLDMNQLYLSYSEIDDAQYKIDEKIKQFNHSFYNKEVKDDE